MRALLRSHCLTSRIKFMKLIKQEKIFENAPFEQCHASTIISCGNDTKICAWFGGTKEGENDVRIWYSRQSKGVWSVPKAIPSVADAPHWNPVLFETNAGEITLFYKIGPTVPQWKTFFTVTRDGGSTWSTPKELIEGDESDGRGPVKNKPIRIANNIILAPASTERGMWRCFVDRFDGGKWEKAHIPVSPEAESTLHMIQPSLWEDKLGEIHALMRTRNGYIYRSDSLDGGKTWRKAYPIAIHNNNSGLDCVQTSSGLIALVCNPIPPHMGRTPLSLMISEDNGEHFKKALDLETAAGEYSYPAVISEANKLFITYTYDRKSIAFAEVEI